MLQIRPSDRHGRGLFATRRLPPGVLLTTAVAVPVDDETCQRLGGSALEGMFVEWDDEGTAVLPLGPLALVNHADRPNCEIVLDDDEELGASVQLWSLSAIGRGEELTIDYLAGDRDRTLWFEPAR